MRLRGVLVAVLALLVVAPSCSRDPKVRSRKYVEVANKYLEKNKLKEAVIMYRKAISVDRMNPEAYYRLGTAELKMGQIGPALREFQRTLDLQPKNMDARSNLADIYLRAYAGKPEARLRQELEEQIRLFRKADPHSFQALRLEAYLLFLDGNMKEALPKFEAANQAKPFQADIVQALVQVLASANRFPEAETLAKSFLQKQKDFLPLYTVMYMQYMGRNRPDDAENILKSEIENNPNKPAPVLHLATHYFFQKRRPEMVKTLDRLLSNNKDFPDGRLYVGDFYSRFREWDEANRNYQAGIRTNPKNKNLYQKRLALLLVDQGRKQDAAQYLAEILKADPKDSDARAIHASLLLETGSTKDLATAISELQALIPKANDNPVLRYDLGRAYMLKGEFSQAEVQFKEAIKIKPDYDLPRLLLAQLELFKSNFAVVQQMANEILRMDPRSVKGLMLRARALAGLKKYDEARVDLMMAQKLDPKSADIAFQLGFLQSLERNYKAAETTFQDLYRKSDYRGLAGLTEIYAAQGQYDRAIQLLQGELKKTPSSTTIRSYIGNMAVRAQKYDMAIGEFKYLIGQNPRSEDLYLRLGETYHRNHDTKNATECFQKARELVPNDPVPHLQLALLLESVGHRSEAKTVYEQTLKLQPDNPIALNNLAFILAETGGDLNQALTYAQRAKQQLPQSTDVGDTLGWIYIKKNLSDNAVEVFRDIVGKQPQNPVYRYHYGMALLQKGDKLGAKRELQVALRLQPSPEDAGRIRELIAKIG